MIGRFEPSLQDLNILGLDHGTLVRRQMRNCILGTTGAAVAVTLACAGVGVLSVLPIAVTIATTPIVLWIAPLLGIRRDSRRSRVDMNITVAVFLDLVNVLVAGGAGIETAMSAAANAGDGASFQRIRVALAAAQGTRSSYWESLRDLGADIGVTSLEDVANSVQLAGEHGARIRLTLAAKARALRSSNLARIEHDAQQRTELMGLPIVTMFLGFVLLIGYPAFVSTIGAL